MDPHKLTLEKRVLETSIGETWEDAVKEWDIVDFKIDYSVSSQCVCDQEGLKYLFKIWNRETDVTLFPIGSDCIKHFGRSDLTEEVAVYEELFKLFNLMKSHQMIKFTSEFFSRKLLKFLYQHNAFHGTKYNKWDGFNDYKFMLDMFNKRTPITYFQQRKVNALLVTVVIPYIRNTMQQHLIASH